MYSGFERFTANGHEIDISMSSFWQWAYSDLSNNINRSVFAEYIVATAIGSTVQPRIMWRPFDLLSNDGFKVEVKSAAYVQSWDAKHPDHINFRIAPARLPDETGDYKIETKPTRNSDLYVFCIYKAFRQDESPLNLDLWEFYVLPTKVLDEKVPNQKTITLPSLMRLEPMWCDYYGLSDAIQKIMNV